jgi:phosphoribosylformylglycinamidine synthase I
MSKKIKFGVVAFPGSNCDEDCVYVLRDVIGCDVRKIWHKEASVGDVDAVCLPGGFSYGDYLRTGAIARFSPVMKDVVRFANAGKPVIGICNGFQILLESGLLPGAMLRNRSLLFECRTVNLKVENTGTLFTKKYSQGQVIRVPIAHGEGNYFAEPDTIQRLEDNAQVLVRYVDEKGAATDAANPNGSLRNIAGITNEKRNVFGLMPHPERCSEAALGGIDGRNMFLSIVESLS